MSEVAAAPPRAFLSYKRLALYSVLLFAAGGVLLVGLMAWWWPMGVAVLGTDVYAKLALAALLGALCRGLRRKVFFGRSVSLHQSFSFEMVVQFARLASPLLPHRALEHEFMVKETGMDPAAVNSWARTRLATTGVLLFLVLAAFLWRFGLSPLAALAALAGGAALLLSCRRDSKAGRMALTVVAGLLIWLAEGGCFVWALSALMPPSVALTLYLAFTFAFDFTVAPFGVGVAELAVFVAWPVDCIWPLLFFHTARVALLSAFALVYLRRYKFAFRDFFDSDIVLALKGTRRPSGGWPFDANQRGEGAPTSLSVVIPAFNEEKRLPVFLESVVEYMRSRPDLEFEVLVVDDGSSDGTAEAVVSFAVQDPRIKLVSHKPNRGKGAAVRRGVFEATGNYILYVDADGATPIRELDRLLPFVSTAEIVIGSRKIEGPGVVRARQGGRALLGLVFYSIVNCLAVPGIHDTQCGFKLLRRDVARTLFGRLLQKGWAFDVEMLYLAQMLGYAVKEVPVNWHEVSGSKISPVKDSLKMLLAVFKIRGSHGGFLKRG